MTASVTPAASPTAAALEFRFRWNAAEHRQFYRALHRVVTSSAKNRSLLWVIRLFPAAALAVAFGTGDGWRVGLGAALGYGLIMLVLSALGRVGGAYWSAREYARTHACVTDDQVRVLSAAGIEARCATSTTAVQWHGIQRVVETPEFFLFLTTPRCAIQLPKRAVGGPAELEAVRELTRQMVGERAQLDGAAR